MLTNLTDTLVTARNAVSSGTGMAQIPSPLRILHQHQICPSPSSDWSLGPQASYPSGEALGKHWLLPPNVWDTRPSSELSSGFSLRLTHCPLPRPEGSVCRRSLPSWGLCTARRHAQLCSLNHPLDSGSQALSPYPPQPPDAGRPSSEASKPKPFPGAPPQQSTFPGVSRSSRVWGAGKGAEGLTWRGTSGTKGSSAY